MNSRVTVIVPTYNRAHFLPECLDALLAQIVPASEIIVVNDGSTDGTLEALAPYRSRIVYLEKPNGGKASALNMGLAHATGEFIWIFDDDDISLPGALETHLEAFSNDPSVDFTYSGYHVAITDPETGILKIVETYEPFRGLAKSLFLAYVMGASGEGIGSMTPQAMLVRKRCYDIVGPFDESFSRSEDREMNLRLCRSFRGLRIDRPTCILRRHDGVRGPSFDLHPNSERNEQHLVKDRLVFRKLYETMPVHMYLDVPNPGEKVEDHMGDALVARARIMARLDLDDFVTRDLTELKELVCENKVALDRKILESLFALEVLYQHKGRLRWVWTVYKLIKDLVCQAGNERKIRRHVAKYYYWKSVEHFRRGQRGEIFLGILKALAILGFRGFLAIKIWRR
ncbi:MAG: glycosyltransferase family 2 protein [Deltaproteobacteria bacterium]|nr:glycosyltransferase family 2 protein [Deltaproteobacteria bacterium]